VLDKKMNEKSVSRSTVKATLSSTEGFTKLC